MTLKARLRSESAHDSRVGSPSDPGAEHANRDTIVVK